VRLRNIPAADDSNIHAHDLGAVKAKV